MFSWMNEKLTEARSNTRGVDKHLHCGLGGRDNVRGRRCAEDGWLLWCHELLPTLVCTLLISLLRNVRYASL
jgi:hypothetical protein